MELANGGVNRFRIRLAIVACGVCAWIAVIVPGTVNGQARFRPSALCEAIVSGNVTRATQLIQRGADVNASYGCALVAAAGRGQLKMAELLLDRGADPNRHVSGDLSVIMGGSTPLVAAVQSQDIRMLSLLLERGANPRDDFEAFGVVLNLGDVEMADMLLRHGAHANMTSPIDGPVYAYVDGRQVTVPQRDLAPDRIDETAKRLQCRISSIAAGTSLLHLAVGSGPPAAGDGQERITKLLLEKNADPNARTLNGTTPLMEAASQHHHAIMKMLMDAGADVTAVDRCGRSAENYAVLFPRHQRASLAAKTKALLQEHQPK